MENSKDKNERKDRLNARTHHGDDPIEIEKNQAKRFNDMGTFSQTEGRVGDEETDLGDLPKQDLKHGTKYDPAVATGKPTHPEFRDQQDIRVVNVTKAGTSNKKSDSYTDEEGNKKISDEKRENQEEVINEGNKENS
jgi:hypothetical protein